MTESAYRSDDTGGGVPSSIWVILFLALSIGVYIAARMFWVTETMEASRLAMGVFSRVDGPGFVLIGLGIAQLFVKRGVEGFIVFLFAGMIGLAMVYFSYFGAIDLAESRGPDMFWKAVVSEQGCFPSEWIPVAEARGFNLPAEDKLCGHKG